MFGAGEHQSLSHQTKIFSYISIVDIHSSGSKMLKM